jgi:hypothetical protein
LAAAELLDPSFSVGPWPLSKVAAALWLAPFLVALAVFAAVSDEVTLLAEFADLAAFAEAALLALLLAVELLVLPLLAEALLFAAADFTLLAVSALLDEEASVAAFVLFALLDAEDMSVEEALLLALAF